LDDPDEPLQQLFLDILQPASFGIIAALGAMVLLLASSALISGSEVAFFSLGPKERKDLESSKSRASNVILRLLEKPKRLLAAILIGNNFVNVAIIILSTYVTAALFNFGNYPFLGFIIQVVMITFLILLIGEVVPKVYATKYALNLALFMAFPILFLRNIFNPLSSLLINSTSFIDKRIRKISADISAEDLSHAIELTKDEEASEEEHKILKGIAKFGSTDVKQIMKSRVDVVAFEIETKFDVLLSGILKSGFSRIPIFKESFDKVEGILYIKDLLPHFEKGDNFNWKELIRPPFFVPENKKIDDLLKEFQEKKIHLAIVVDEYGGTSGIVTLEDIIEEIVGDITDEFDEENLVYSKLDENNYVFDGKTPLNDLYRILDIDGNVFEETKGESDTIAGFILELAGKIPLKNEKVNFENFTFTVEAADKRRVKRVKVTILEKQEKEIEE